MLRHLLLLILCFIVLQSYGQTEGFLLLKDSTYHQGYFRYNPRKPWRVKFKLNRPDDYRIYSVNEVISFGNQNKNIYYIPKKIPVAGKEQDLFVEVIGDSLFYYLEQEKLFFKAKKQPDVIHKKDLLPYLQLQVPASSKWYDELHLFRQERNPLRYFADYHTSAKPPTVLFVNRGLFTSFNSTTLTADGTSVYGSRFGRLHANSSNLSVGIFADLPIWPIKNLSLYTPLSYGRLNFSDVKESEDIRFDVKLKMDILRFSMMPKYSRSFSKWRIFAYGGPGAFYVLKNESQTLEARTEGDKVYLFEPALLSVDKPFFYGFEIGSGFSCFYLPGYYVSVGISQAYNRSSHFSTRNLALTVSANL